MSFRDLRYVQAIAGAVHGTKWARRALVLVAGAVLIAACMVAGRCDAATTALCLFSFVAGGVTARLLSVKGSCETTVDSEAVSKPEETSRPSLIDPVTGLANQRYLEMFLEQEISRCERSKAAMTVLLIDIDDFGRLVASNSEDETNLCVAALGQAFREMLRAYDVVARYKDDEFVVVLPGTDIHTGTEIAGRMHGLLSGQILPLRARFSVGVAAYPEHGTSIDTLLGSAHHALNRAKFSGKNRVRGCHELAKAS